MASARAGRKQLPATAAEVVRVPGNYDRAVQRSFADAETLGYFVVSDDKSAEYPHIAREIMQGYAMVADEIAQQFRGAQPPTHVFVPRWRRAICRCDLRAFVGSI